MDDKDNQEASGARLVLLIAVVALVVATSLAFARVFQGSRTSIRLALAGVAAVLIAIGLERRNVLLSTVGSGAGLVVAIGWLVFPETLWAFLPTTATVRATTSAFARVGHAAAVEVAPAPPVDALVLAGLCAVWAAAFSSHALAVRARSPFLALLPPAALVGFTNTVVGDGARPVYVAIVLLAALAVLFGDALRRVGQWGPVTPWRGRTAAATAITARGARRVAAACLAVAAFTPWILPGFGRPGSLAVHGNSSGVRVSVDPIVDLRPKFLRNPTVELFTVRSTHPAYWRFLALDVFDGQKWNRADLNLKSAPQVGTGVLRPPFSPRGGSIRYSAHFEFENLVQPWVPLGYEPVELRLSGETVRYDAASSSVVLANWTYPGLAYDAMSIASVPAPRELDSVTSLHGDTYRPWTRLPSDMPPEISVLAHRITDAQPTPYRKILAVQYFLRQFTYDLNASPGHSASDLLYFLTESRRGYCEQFAGAMAVLLRALDIPSRVAVGFTPGRWDSGDRAFHVTGANAHAWVEVLFPDFGWLAFEPTPTRQNPIASPYAFASINLLRSDDFDCAGEGCFPGQKKDPRSETPAGKNPANFEPPSERESFGAERIPPRKPSLVPLFVRLGIVLLLLALLAIPVVKWVRRRLVLARASSPRDRVLAAYEVVSDEAADLGVGRMPHETPAEYRGRLAARLGTTNGDLETLTRLTGRAAYSSEPLTDEQAAEAIVAAHGVSRDIRRSSGRLRSVLGWFRVERFSANR